MKEDLSLIGFLASLAVVGVIGILSGFEKRGRQPSRRKAGTGSTKRLTTGSDEALINESKPASPLRTESFPTIRPGDVVTYAFIDVPDRHITITVSHLENEPSLGLLPTAHPLIKAMNDADANEGDAVELPAAGRWKAARIVKIVRPSANTPT